MADLNSTIVRGNLRVTGDVRGGSLNASDITSGTLAAARLASSGVTAGSYGSSSAPSPAFGGTFSIPYITVDSYGRVTAAANKTVTVPSATATTTDAGLMSATDKTRLDGIWTSFNDDDNDTTVNRLKEILNIFSTWTEGNNVLTYLSNNYAAKSHTHSYLPLSGGNISGGSLMVNTSTGTYSFNVSRTGGTAENVAMWVNDSEFRNEYTNDEASSSIVWRMVNTDTERAENKGADASDKQMVLTSSKSGMTLSVGGSTMATQTWVTNNYSASGHTHSYLPLAGGTMTGNLNLLANQYSRQGALNCNNSDIMGVNSIYTQDLADNTAEGIRFYRDSTHWDSLTASGGTLYFMPNDGNDGSAFSSAKKVAMTSDIPTNTNQLTNGANFITKSDLTKADITGLGITDVTSSSAAAQNGTDLSFVTTGEKYTWNSKATGSVTKTAGSEAVTISSNTVNVATRDTAQTISGLKRISNSSGIDISSTDNAHTYLKGSNTNTSSAVTITLPSTSGKVVVDAMFSYSNGTLTITTS